ncbi:MAG: hypothetical protein LBH46_02140 [Rickettsiales bacterium]|jgi:alpha/beta superfamily hydrolase|nr:hypothetical protein [Rickettsiales bacterium]
MLKEVHLVGPGCKLKAFSHQNIDMSAPVALIITQESQNQSIVQATINTLIENGFSVIFFDFERVDNIIKNEVEKREVLLTEIVYVIDFIMKERFYSSSFWLISFGNIIWESLQAIIRRPEITDFVLFNPTQKNNKDISFLIPCSLTGMIVYNDTKKEQTTLIKNIINRITTKDNGQIKEIFFDDDINSKQSVQRLAKTLDDYVKSRVELTAGEIKRVRRDKRRRKKKIVKEEITDKQYKAIRPLSV